MNGRMLRAAAFAAVLALAVSTPISMPAWAQDAAGSSAGNNSSASSAAAGMQNCTPEQRSAGDKDAMSSNRMSIACDLGRGASFSPQDSTTNSTINSTSAPKGYGR